MARRERARINLRELRERALIGREDLAEELGLSKSHLTQLEIGDGATRLSTLYQFSLVLARHLQLPPSKVFDELIPEETYGEVEPIRQKAGQHYASLKVMDGNLKAKRKFAKQSESLKRDPSPPEAVSFVRIQKLFAASNYTQVELSDLAGISIRRINDFLSYGAARTGNVTLALFLELVAALTPVYRVDASVKETAFYVLEGDLARLDALHKAEPER